MIIEELYLKANFLVNFKLQPTLLSKPILKNEIIKQAISQGVYFITTEENADKIIEESLINSPEPFFSYGLKKALFYGGIPTFPVACLDMKLPIKMVAIKMNIPYETLALFTIDINNNAYKLFYPNLLTENCNLQKVYLGLMVEDFKFGYQEIDANNYENYEVQIPSKNVKTIEKNLAKEIKTKLKIIKQIKNQR